MTSRPSLSDRGRTMVDEVRHFDWASHAFGPVESWTPTLRTMVALVLDTSLLATLMWGPDLRLVYNDAYAPALGHRRPGSLGAPVSEVWADIWEEGLAPSFLPVLRTGVPVFAKRFPLVMERDGAMVTTYWDYSVTAVRDGEGDIVGLLNIALDVTDEVTNEEALLAAHSQLRDANLDLQVEVRTRTGERNRMWALAQELMLVAHPDGRIEEVNPRWHDALGRRQEILRNQLFQHLVHPDDVAAASAMLRQVHLAPVSTPVELRLRHSDGSYRLFAWVGAYDEGRLYATGRDITVEREQLESLRQSQKMEAVGQLTGGIAHDFNNLLGGISGAIEMAGLRAEQGRLSDVDTFLASGLGAVKRAAALTHRLLAFSRRQALAPVPTDVDALVDGMLELITRTVGPGIQVEVKRSRKDAHVLVDQPQLENALLNLCINARDAMAGNGCITIETGERRVDDTGAHADGLQAGLYVSLCVTDTGVGMSREVAARAFDPFFTTKPMGQGTGLGLSMIYGFVRQSGGHVTICSKEGDGTGVTLYLPVYSGGIDREESAASISAAGRHGHATVFVVDDEPTVRLLVTSVLEDAGYTVIEASDSAGGRRILESDARIDLLVTDVGLPGGMNGKEMAMLARALRPTLRVLFITGYADVFDGSEHREPGIGVLHKPFGLDAFREAVHALLQLPAGSHRA